MKVFFVRLRADIVAVMNSNDVYVDKYTTLTLDASNSYDSETGQKGNFTFNWKCPASINACTNNKGSTLNVAFSDRVSNSINDEGLQRYSYEVKI